MECDDEKPFSERKDKYLEEEERREEENEKGCETLIQDDIIEEDRRCFSCFLSGKEREVRPGVERYARRMNEMRVYRQLLLARKKAEKKKCQREEEKERDDEETTWL